MDRRKLYSARPASNRHRLSSYRGKERMDNGPRRPRPRFRSFIEASFRWGVLVLLIMLLAGSITARRAAVSDAARLESELAELEREKAQLREEINRFADPEWRESYWKWRTMRHEPGEYYIDFIEPGTL
jgi:cell division protein FtsB